MRHARYADEHVTISGIFASSVTPPTGGRNAAPLASPSMIAAGHAQILIRTPQGWRWRLLDAGGRPLITGLASSQPLALRAAAEAVARLRRD